MEKLIGSNKQLTPENVDAFLKKPIITNLATINRDGSPQVTPVWHLYDGEKIRIMSASTAVKVRNIQRDARVTLSIAGHTEPYQYVLIKGNAVESYNGIWDFLIAIPPPLPMGSNRSKCQNLAKLSKLAKRVTHPPNLG